MSLDLIKKQKEALQKERRKVAKSADFCRHPLAYQPKAKGREVALKDTIVKTKGKLDSVALANSQRKSEQQDFKISPDKNAAALFFSNMQAFNSGKRGNHIADVFAPNNQLPFEKKREVKKQNSIARYERASFRGYNETEARLKINLGREKAEKMRDLGLSETLFDLDSDLPYYDPKDINRDPFQIVKQGANQKDPLNSSKRDVEKNPDFMEEVFLEQQERIRLKEKPQNNEFERERPEYNTSVKLSFARPNTTLVLEVADEEEEEEEKNYKTSVKEQDNSESESFYDNRIEDESDYLAKNYPSDNANDNPFEPVFHDQSDKITNDSGNINVVDLTKVSRGNGYSGRSGVSIPINKDGSGGQTLMSDYTPEANYTFEKDPDEQRSNTINSQIKNKLSNFLGLKGNLFKEKTQIIDYEFKNGREYQEDKKPLNTDFSSSLAPIIQEQVSPVAEEDEEEEESYSFDDLNLKPNNQIFLREKKESKIKRIAKKILTRREEKALEKSFLVAKKPALKFQKNFFTFRSGNSKRSFAVLSIAITIALTVPLGAYVQKVIEAKSKIEENSKRALDEVNNAKTAMASAKPEEARHNFQTAYQEFLSANESLDQVGGVMLSLIKVIPGGEKVESGRKILEAGKHLTMAGQIISEAFGLFLGEESSLRKKLTTTDNLSSLKEVATFSPEERTSEAKTLTDAIVIFKDKLDKAKIELTQANELLKEVDEKAVPESKRDQLVKLKDQLPLVLESMNSFEDYTGFLLNLLGHNQSKTYLFLFENNDEIRATGGFIGTYGIIKINEGEISQLFVDGIYNPDGQLKERIIPPKPIQKMSATWSMHDANWWPDFPKSAQKIAWFYEKTGGPTVDGVIALTPKIMKSLLEITGPIKMDQYGTTVTADNFVEVTQYKVEVDYDKKMNRPKQFLADLTPIILSKIFNSPAEKWVEVLKSFAGCLEERQILMYFLDPDAEQKISELGWSGEILNTPKDYLSVVNTNISGLKTDHVIDQKIDHSVEIKPDGSIFDTVSISRTHKGGKEKYDWYNGVNSDWMRVYVPKGSQLLSAEGYTREVDSPPVDYEKLGFIKDEMVSEEEDKTTIDPYSGTRIYEDSEKTVFANWTYVSPGETLVVKYTYLLPFKLRFDDIKKPADTYSLLVQKQAGDEHSKFTSTVKGLDNFDIIYNYPKEIPLPNWKIEKDLNDDVFSGVVMTEKGKGREVIK